MTDPNNLTEIYNVLGQAVGQEDTLAETIQAFAQWPLLGVIILVMLRFWRRSDDNFVGIINELRKSLVEEREARVLARKECEEEIQAVQKRNEEEIQALQKRIVYLETLLDARREGRDVTP